MGMCIELRAPTKAEQRIMLDTMREATQREHCTPESPILRELITREFGECNFDVDQGYLRVTVWYSGCHFVLHFKDSSLRGDKASSDPAGLV